MGVTVIWHATTLIFYGSVTGLSSVQNGSDIRDDFVEKEFRLVNTVAIYSEPRD
ncbi:hypothetical protein EJ05DRAFT_397869 [Pseudovirgaria hyperparasitica]|uniref:Uncharacterized protein n=1 Tax=Pseudovirgaria hyperparasitica TaxID=470096 RepID=A0A6A6W707_9PEZI|nr:uncharacterized protein EJ05DRAFT_397869 [Pseudovirgaria hyperparasitica]KAF2757696.1 hypothetical protein EJ05DRAFT_397869 [Pseudovirgaria hyperparasitica]